MQKANDVPASVESWDNKGFVMFDGYCELTQYYTSSLSAISSVFSSEMFLKVPHLDVKPTSL